MGTMYGFGVDDEGGPYAGMAPERKREPMEPGLRPYEPSYRDALAALLLGDRPGEGRMRFVDFLLGSRGAGTTGLSASDLTPLSILFGANESRQDVDNDNLLGAVLNAASVIPVAGVVPRAGRAMLGAGKHGVRKKSLKTDTYELEKSDKTLASRSVNLYNPAPRPQRAFSEDYPRGAEANPDGTLTRTIDNDPIRARFVVGRRVAEGADEALPPAEFDAATTAIVGAPAKITAQSELGSDVGRTLYNRFNRRPEGVLLSEKLTPEQLPKVYAHEVSHVIDQAAREIPVTKRISAAVRDNYNDLNNPDLAQARLLNPDVDPSVSAKFRNWGPERSGYKGDDVERELIAEALRHYAFDPNSMKTRYPELARYLRRAINRDPEISKVIQFNSLAGLLGLGAFGASQSGEASPAEELLAVN